MAETPVIYTERLTLRPMAPSDFKEFCAYFSQKDVKKFVGCDRIPIEQIFQNNLTSPLTWAITHSESGKMIGDIHFGHIAEGVLAQIGYVLDKEFQGNGFMTEAILNITAFGFEAIGFKRIRAILRADNQKSEKVLIRCGFQKEFLLRDGDFNGRVADLLYYSKTEFLLSTLAK